MQVILVFFFISLINVILQTAKSVLTIKASRAVASTINAIAFGFYTIVVKMIGGTDIYVAAGLTVLANLIGVWVALLLIDKFKKDKVWRIIISCNKNICEAITDLLQANKIPYSLSPILYKDHSLFELCIYSNNQSESLVIKDILSHFNVKYFVSESGHNL
jgi:hypothetical protein